MRLCPTLRNDCLSWRSLKLGKMEKELGDDESELPQLRIDCARIFISIDTLLLLGFPNFLGLLQLLLLLLLLFPCLLLQFPLLLLFFDSLLLSQLFLLLSLSFPLMLPAWCPGGWCMALVFLRRLVLMMIVNGVVIVIVVKHESLQQLIEVLLKVLSDRCAMAN